MAKNTSVLLGDYFDELIHRQVKSGRFSSASEVIRAALRLFELEETRKKEMVKALVEGEQSGIAEGFDRNEIMKGIHSKYLKDGAQS